MDLPMFAYKYVGSTVTARGGLGGECVDLVNQYLVDVLQKPEVHANAADWPKRFRPGLKWVLNNPTNFPMPGAVVVWGQNAIAGTGPNGHIAVVVRAGPMALITLDQNWPEGAQTMLRVHGYQGVLGWFTVG